MERVLFAPRALSPLRPDVAGDARRYDAWVRERELARGAQSSPPSPSRPLHVALIVDGRPPPETLESLRSLRGQVHEQWKLTVTLARSWQRDVLALLKTARIGRPIALAVLDDEANCNAMLQAGLDAVGTEDVALMFPGDVWAPDTLLQLSTALDQNGVAYGDEDCMDDRGMYSLPRLKPSFSPEFLLHADCVGRPLALSADVVARLPKGSAGVIAARDHDLALRACEVAHSVRHIPEVLCHRRIPPDSWPMESAEDRQHVGTALARRGEHADTTPGVAPGTIGIIRSPKAVKTASLIIPFRDEPRFLRACFDSIERTMGEVVPEFLLVDNGSDQPETITLMERLGSRPDVRILRDDQPFNWAKLNNAAAAQATGDALIFLNNDIEALTPGWIDSLCAQVERPDVGAVGARLLYQDHRVQHCGVVIGLGGAAGHLFVGLDEGDPGYLAMAVTTRECSAVTGACLATRRSVFEHHGRFDESLEVDLNDVDYCLRVQRSGLRVLYEATAELIHHESPSRGTTGEIRDIIRFIDRWKSSILAGDPYLNPHLTRVDSSCALRAPGEEEWWHRWHLELSET